MGTKPLTEKQKDILRYIARHVMKLGFQPSYDEIAKHFGWNGRTAARSHLVAIERKGVVVLNGESRAVAFKWRLWAKKKRRAR
jgi:repressor LexA